MKSNKTIVYIGLFICIIAGFFLFKIMYLDNNSDIALDDPTQVSVTSGKKLNIEDFDLSVFQDEKFLRLKERAIPDLAASRVGKTDIFKKESK